MKGEWVPEGSDLRRVTRDSHFFLGGMILASLISFCTQKPVGAGVYQLVLKSETGFGAAERKGSQQL